MVGLKPSNIPINLVKLQSDIFEITSKTSGRKYEVDIKRGTCTCPQYKFRLAKTGGHCKHINEVFTYLKEITSDNSTLFDNIEKYIKEQNNNADWQKVADNFGDDAINEMIRLGIIFKRSNSRLGVLE